MPRKGKGVRRILREEHRFQEKRKQGTKFRRKKLKNSSKSPEDLDYE